MSKQQSTQGSRRTHSAEQVLQDDLPSLDAVDKRLLWLLDVDPTASLIQLAVELDLSARTVQRRLYRLTSSGVVRVLGRTLPGFDGRLAWLVRAQGHPGAVAELAKHLAEQPHAQWVRTTVDGGELISGLVTGPEHRDATFDVVAEKTGLRNVRTYELLEVWGPRPAVVRSLGRDLDAVDKRIMELLEVDGRMDSSSLAESLGLDRSTVSRRRRRLVEEGIMYFEADIHPSALGDGGDVFCWVQVRPGSIRDVAVKLRSLPQVRFTAAITGGSNLAVHIVLPAGISTIDFIDQNLSDPAVTAVEIQSMGRVFKRNA